MWNKGTCMVNAGALAVMNNVLVSRPCSEHPDLEQRCRFGSIVYWWWGYLAVFMG